MVRRRWNTLLESAIILAAVSGLVGCSDEGDNESVTDVVGDASTCQEILDGVQFADLDADGAAVVADRMLSIASEQVADDGVIEEKVACSTIIRELDEVHPGAVEGTDLERLEEETRAELDGG
jgi:hypothetical protein